MKAVTRIRALRDSYARPAAPLRRARSAVIDMPVNGHDTLQLDFGWPGHPGLVLDRDGVANLRHGLGMLGRERAHLTFKALMPALSRDDLNWLASTLEQFLEKAREEDRREGRGYERARAARVALGA